MNSMKAEDLVKLIRQRYPLDRPDGYQSHVVLEQVPDGTGVHLGHWIDAVVFSLWESKGLFRAAFEVKVSRSDFIHELQKPLKHQWVLECFHEFWFVAPQEVIQLDELPPSIGWMCPRGSKLVIKRHAIRNPNPKLDDVLLAAFMRAAAKEINRVSHTAVKDVLDGNKEYQLGKIYKEVTTNFLTQRGVNKYRDPDNPQELLKWLEEATLDSQLKEDRDRLLHILGQFQREVISLLKLFLVIASKSLVARDELGKYIVSTFGGEDPESIETLKEHIKGAKGLDSEKRYIEIVELVLNWDREFSA